MNLEMLEDYAISNNFDPKKMIDDYLSSPEEDQIELLSHIMKQAGGTVEQSSEEDIMQLIQAYAEMSGSTPEEIVKQLQEMPEEEQQAAIQSMAQELQSNSGPQEEEMPEQEIASTGYDARSIMGYSDSSPYKYDTSNLINSNNVTMTKTGIDYKSIKSIIDNL